MDPSWKVRDTDARLARCDAEWCVRAIVIGAGVSPDAYEGWSFVRGSILCPVHSESLATTTS